MAVEPLPHNSDTSGEVATEAETTVAVLNSPYCSELRSKKYFYLETIATDAGQYLDGSNHCWCYDTQQVVGPDGSKAAPARCVPGRSCYHSALADIT